MALVRSGGAVGHDRAAADEVLGALPLQPRLAGWSWERERERRWGVFCKLGTCIASSFHGGTATLDAGARVA